MGGHALADLVVECGREDQRENREELTKDGLEVICGDGAASANALVDVAVKSLVEGLNDSDAVVGRKAMGPAERLLLAEVQVTTVAGVT